MIFTIISLFLIFMAVLAMFGRLRIGNWRIGRRGPERVTRKCPACGSPVRLQAPLASVSTVSEMGMPPMMVPM